MSHTLVSGVEAIQLILETYLFYLFGSNGKYLFFCLGRLKSRTKLKAWAMAFPRAGTNGSHDVMLKSRVAI